MKEDRQGVAHNNRGDWQSAANFISWSGNAEKSYLICVLDFAMQLKG